LTGVDQGIPVLRRTDVSGSAGHRNREQENLEEKRFE
jgi:hypothetical protein